MNLNGNNVTVSGLTNDVNLAGSVIFQNNNSSSAATLTVNNSSANTYNGIFADGSSKSLLLTKSGNGTLTLAGASTIPAPPPSAGAR